MLPPLNEELDRLPPQERALMQASLDYARAFMLGFTATELNRLRRRWCREYRRRWPGRWPRRAG